MSSLLYLSLSLLELGTLQWYKCNRTRLYPPGSLKIPAGTLNRGGCGRRRRARGGGRRREARQGCSARRVPAPASAPPPAAPPPTEGHTSAAPPRSRSRRRRRCPTRAPRSTIASSPRPARRDGRWPRRGERETRPPWLFRRVGAAPTRWARADPRRRAGGNVRRWAGRRTPPSPRTVRYARQRVGGVRASWWGKAGTGTRAL